MKQLPIIILCGVLTFSSVCQGTEYVYPVGHFDMESSSVLLLYQKSVHHLELWQWDPHTYETHKALLSRFTPAGVSMLPDGKGFSFIDNDTIRLKYTHKRSPTLLELYEPLYDFTTLAWFNETHCILSAKEKERFGIYIIDTQGQCWQVLHDSQYDYRYPVLHDNHLFYIKRNDAEQHAIMQATVDLAPLSQKKNVTVQDFYDNNSARDCCPVYDEAIILNCNERPATFLTMINAQEGFYIEHPARIDRHDTTITFNYHHITKQESTWHDSALFSFTIPAALFLSSDQRLYESILPLIPRAIGRYIYYVDCDAHLILQLMRYDHVSQTTKQLTHAAQAILGPYYDGATLWYGGVLLHDEQSNIDPQVPSTFVNNEGQFCMQLPTARLTKKESSI